MYASLPLTPIPQLNVPVVLVHGLCGYDRIMLFGWTLREYFPGIREALETAGNRVLVPQLSWTRGITDRAAELKRFIERQVPNGPVHLIGHSMGGLDARYMISRLGMASRVLSLTTIGTPHRGSAFADWGIRLFRRVGTPFFSLLGLSIQAFLDLTTASCRRFNDEVPDAPGVRYYAVSGQCGREWFGPGWRLAHRIVSEVEGPNDGVVSVTSSAWGQQTEVWDGDHLNLVNWPNRRAKRQGLWVSRVPDYGRLVRRLVASE